RKIQQKRQPQASHEGGKADPRGLVNARVLLQPAVETATGKDNEPSRNKPREDVYGSLKIMRWHLAVKSKPEGDHQRTCQDHAIYGACPQAPGDYLRRPFQPLTARDFASDLPIPLVFV